MSGSLRWRPAHPDGQDFDEDADGLRFALREIFDDSFTTWQSMTRGDIEVLRGIAAGATKNSSTARAAMELIKKIERYGEVEVREFYG